MSFLGAQLPEASVMLTGEPCVQNASAHVSGKEADMVGRQRSTRRSNRSTHGSVDSEEDVTGNMTQKDTMHGSKAAADVQPKAPSQPEKKGREVAHLRAKLDTTAAALQNQDA